MRRREPIKHWHEHILCSVYGGYKVLQQELFAVIDCNLERCDEVNPWEKQIDVLSQQLDT